MSATASQSDMFADILKKEQFLSNKNPIQVAALAAWFLLLFVVIWALSQQTDLKAQRISPVARLSYLEGGVQVRAEGRAGWLEAGRRQNLFDGEQIATGANARARIDLSRARTLDLGEKTQVQITAILRASGERAFLVKVLRGTVVGRIESNCKVCSPIILRAGTETFNVTSGQELGVFRPPGREAVSFDPQGPWPSLITDSY